MRMSLHYVCGFQHAFTSTFDDGVLVGGPEGEPDQRPRSSSNNMDTKATADGCVLCKREGKILNERYRTLSVSAPGTHVDRIERMGGTRLIGSGAMFTARGFAHLHLASSLQP